MPKKQFKHPQTKEDVLATLEKLADELRKQIDKLEKKLKDVNAIIKYVGQAEEGELFPEEFLKEEGTF